MSSIALWVDGFKMLLPKNVQRWGRLMRCDQSDLKVGMSLLTLWFQKWAGDDENCSLSQEPWLTVEWIPIASPFAKSQSSENYHQLPGEQRCFQFFIFVFRFVYLCVCDCVCMWTCMYAGQRTTCESPFSPPTVWIPRIQLTSQVWWQPSLLTESPPSPLLVFKMFEGGGLERWINC